MDLRKHLVLLTFILLFALPGLSPGANLIVNGGFETGDFTGWTTIPALQGSDFGVNMSDPHTGSYAAYFGAYGQPTPYYDTILQTFADVSGQSYTVSYYLAWTLQPEEFGITTAYDSMVVDVDGLPPQQFTNVATDTTGDPSYSGPYTFTFTGTGSDTLSFSAYNVPGFTYLDDVSVIGPAPVPEPTTMLLLGSGLIGLVGLWRKFKK